jgi:hypothetical protein
MRDFGARVDIKISDLISVYEAKPASNDLGQLIFQQFELLESALYGAVSRQEVPTSSNIRAKEDRERKEEDRRRQMELRAEEDRRRREEEKAKVEERRQKEEERIRMARIEREDKDKQRREEQDRMEQVRRADMERKRE